MGTGLARRIVRWEWLLLLFLAPVVIMAPNRLAPALLLIPGLWLVRKRQTGRFFVATALDLSLLLLLLMVLVSLYATFDVALSFPKVAGVIYGIAFYYAVAAAAGRSERHLWLGTALLLAAGLGVVGLGLLGGQWPAKLPVLGDLADLLPQRALGDSQGAPGFNSNRIAGALLLVAPLALTLAAVVAVRYRSLPFRDGRGRSRLLLLLLLAVTVAMVGVLLLTQSRAGLLGFGVSLFFLLLAGTGRYRRWLGPLLAVGVLGGGAVVWSVYGPDLRALFFDEPAAVAVTGDALDSLAGRREIWNRALYGIEDFPFTGMGMGTFSRVVHILYPLFLIAPDTDIGHAHNLLLQTALDVGLPGLVAYLSLWLGAGGMLSVVWRAGDAFWLRVLAAGLAASLLAHFVYGLADAVELGARPGLLFWTLLGLTSACYRVSRTDVRLES